MEEKWEWGEAPDSIARQDRLRRIVDFDLFGKRQATAIPWSLDLGHAPLFIEVEIVPTGTWLCNLNAFSKGVGL